MSQKDIYHNAVRNALIKDGWTITHDPYPLEYGDHNLYVDLGAEAPIAAEKRGHKIAVEIKSFIGRSVMTDLERAVGQFVVYRFIMQHEDPDRALFLAVSRTAHAAVFDPAPGRDLIEAQALKLLIFDAEEEVIIRWIE